MLVQPGLFSALPEQFVVYVARHATPDRSRYDIPYNLPPGPDLTERGRQEAAELGAYLRRVGVLRAWTSPFQRAFSTAMIAMTINAAELVKSEPIEDAQVNMAANAAETDTAEVSAASATAVSEPTPAASSINLISPVEAEPVPANLPDISLETDPDLCEWRPDETEALVLERIERGFSRVARVSAQEGPVAIVSHGGPVLTLLKHLGLPSEVVERSRVFDSRNLIPMAGAWRVERLDGVTHLHLVFAPSGVQVPETVPSVLQ